MLVKGRSSSKRLNHILSRINALVLAAGLHPLYGFIQSEWNPSDAVSRRHEPSRRGRASKAQPRGTKRPSRSSDRRGVARDPAGVKRRNRSFDKDFDSTLGYPGEGHPKPRTKAKAKAKASPPRRPPRGAATNAAGILVRRRLVQSVLTKSTQHERAKARRGVDLRTSALAPRTIVRYREAFSLLWEWVGRAAPERALNGIAYDTTLSGFIVHAWESGLPRGRAGDAISASLKAYPELKGGLRESWGLFNSWGRIELPTRAPPLPSNVIVAMAAIALEKGFPSMAFLLILGFDGFLRTCEILNLTTADVSFDSRGRLGVVSLKDTKTGQQNAAFEALPIADPLVYRLWRLHLQHIPPGTSASHFVWPYATQRFYDLFNEILSDLGLSGLGFRPYSIRRGGATAWYRRTANLPTTIERGRWATVKTGRIYICDGMGRELELLIPAPVVQLMAQKAVGLNASLQLAEL